MVEPAIARAREVEAKTRRYLDRIHPAGAEIIHWWLAEMHDVALEGDRAEVERLADNIHRKLTLERLWRLQKRSLGQATLPHIGARGWRNTG